MKKQGYSNQSITTYTKILRILVKRGANLNDPESVKEAIANQSWVGKRKATAVNAYSCLLMMTGGKWDPPFYKEVRKLPFIPTEQEIDQLIAGCGPKTAAFLQLLKETGMRAGEALRLTWTDIDFVNGTVRVTPEKGSEPRIFRISSRLIEMLMRLKNGGGEKRRIFCKDLHVIHKLFWRQRRRVAEKLGNPRLLQIHFHTFRHWKATMEYAKTKDILYVMKVLGHKNIMNTLIYTQLVEFKADEYISKVARSAEEACGLVENGFEYVCTTPDSLMIFRKRK